MEAIAVGGLVVAVVSAFTGIASLFKRNTSSKRAKYNVYALDRSLDLGSLRVQGAYDRDLARLGPRFARGDALAIDQLRDVLIQMQSRMINVLYDLLDGRRESFHQLLDMSEFSRVRALRALADQYQRMAVAAPFVHTRGFERQAYSHFYGQRDSIRDRIIVHDITPDHEIEWEVSGRRQASRGWHSQRVIAEPVDRPVIRRQKSGNLVLVRKSSGHFQRFFT